MSQNLVLINDNTAIRLREKVMLQNDMQTIFFASVAHDLRTPLNSLLASHRTLIALLRD